MLSSPKKNSLGSLFKEVRFSWSRGPNAPLSLRSRAWEKTDSNSSRREHKGKWMGIFLDPETLLARNWVGIWGFLERGESQRQHL